MFLFLLTNEWWGGIRPSAGVVLPLLPPALLHYTINRRKLQAVRQKICAKKVKMLGGVPSLPPAYPAFTFFSAPYPPSPLPRRGRGCPKVYFAGGFAPGTPAFNRLRHLQNLPSRCPAGGLPGWSPAYPAFGLLSCPLSPLPPSPAGKGETSGYFMQGASPLASPGLNPGGTHRACQAGTQSGALPLARRGCGGVPIPCEGAPSASPVRRKTDRTAILLAVPTAKERGGPGERNFGV